MPRKLQKIPLIIAVFSATFVAIALAFVIVESHTTANLTLASALVILTIAFNGIGHFAHGRPAERLEVWRHALIGARDVMLRMTVIVVVFAQFWSWSEPLPALMMFFFITIYVVSELTLIAASAVAWHHGKHRAQAIRECRGALRWRTYALTLVALLCAHSALALGVIAMAFGVMCVYYAAKAWWLVLHDAYKEHRLSRNMSKRRV